MIPTASFAAAEFHYKKEFTTKQFNAFERLFVVGDERVGVWAVCTETSKEGDFKRFRGVNTARDGIVCYIDLHKKGYGYLTIPLIEGMTAERLTEEYIALAKQLRADKLYFNGELIADNLRGA